MHELKVPAQVLADPHSREVLRTWIVGDINVFIAHPGAVEDPFSWGILLVDLARHVAQGYHKDGRGEFDAILSRIKAGFDAEWEVNTNDLGVAIHKQ